MSGGGAGLLAALPRIRYERGAMPSDEPSLADILDGIGRGHWLPADGGVLVLPAPSPRSHGVLGFTAHHLVVTDADPDWVRAQLPPGDLSAPLTRRSSTRCAHGPAAASTTSTWSRSPPPCRVRRSCPSTSSPPATTRGSGAPCATATRCASGRPRAPC